jgi:hypothetical protein
MRAIPCKLPNHLLSCGFNVADGFGTMHLRRMTEDRGEWPSSLGAPT